MSAEAKNPQVNWGGNYSYQAEKILSPQSIPALQEIVRNNQHVKGLGTRHSFNGIADSEGIIVSLANFKRILNLDEATQTVTLEAGVTYGQLCQYLDERGFALENLASLPHISVLGACMTGTHGSGVKHGNLSSAVTAIEFIAANGEIHRVAQGDAQFSGMVVGLGAYGLVTKLTLKVIPRYEMWQQVFLDLSRESLRQNYKDILSSTYSVSLFTTWQQDAINQVWLKAHAEKPLFDSFFGARKASEQLHPIEGADVQACTEQLGKSGAWYERLPHFKMGFQPSSGQEIQSEYFVSLDHALEAIEAVNSLRSQFSEYLFVTEIRTIAADDLWLSPCYQRQSLAIHFTWKPMPDEVMSVLPLIEEKLMPLHLRPHWGKVFSLDSDYLISQYEHFGDFLDLVRRYDPDGKFKNAFLAKFQ